LNEKWYNSDCVKQHGSPQQPIQFACTRLGHTRYKNALHIFAGNYTKCPEVT